MEAQAENNVKHQQTNKPINKENNNKKKRICTELNH